MNGLTMRQLYGLACPTGTILGDSCGIALSAKVLESLKVLSSHHTACSPLQSRRLNCYSLKPQSLQKHTPKCTTLCVVIVN